MDGKLTMLLLISSRDIVTGRIGLSLRCHCVVFATAHLPIRPPTRSVKKASKDRIGRMFVPFRAISPSAQKASLRGPRG